jgi:two-component system response regulator HydG
VPENLLESELFGYEKGAFTGATQRKIGKFESAAGGTIFLDEIGDMSTPLQAKILRVLQNKEIFRLGGNERIQIDTRVIAATNRDLAKMVANGDFREDLYYRLNVFPISIPALRDRKEDIPELVERFLHEFSDMHGKPVVRISDEVMKLISQYKWPGNIRELRNCIESSVVMARGDMLTIDDIPEYLTYKANDVELDDTEGLLHKVERETITNVLDKTAGDKVKAAKILGIGLRTLYRKIDKWGM